MGEGGTPWPGLGETAAKSEFLKLKFVVSKFLCLQFWFGNQLLKRVWVTILGNCQKALEVFMLTRWFPLKIFLLFDIELIIVQQLLNHNWVLTVNLLKLYLSNLTDKWIKANINLFLEINLSSKCKSLSAT